MTSYQFFMVEDFPKFTKARREISNQVQMTITGAPETIHTKITPVPATHHKDGFERLRVETGIKYEVFGYTYVPFNGKLERKDFSEYVKTVEFPAYVNRDANTLILKASDKVAKGFLKNVEQGNTGIKPLNAEIDFDKVHKQNPTYIAAWFKGISPNVRSLGMSGFKIEDTEQFRQCLALGVISALAMEYPYEGVQNGFVLGKRASVSLYKNYTKSHINESSLIIKIFDEIVSESWSLRKTGKKDLSVPTIVDPEFHDFDPKFLDHKPEDGGE